MAICKIIKDYYNVEGWKKGDIVDISEPAVLIQQGKVKLISADEVKQENKEMRKTVEAAAEGAQAEFADSFKCSVCGKVCKSAAGLKSHMRAHK